MIRVDIDLIPYGVESRKQNLRRLLIWNNGTGDDYSGNYEYYLLNSGVDKKHPDECISDDIDMHGKIYDHRRDSGVVRLLQLVMADLS